MNILNIILFVLSAILVLSVIIRYILNILKHGNYNVWAIKVGQGNKRHYQLYDMNENIIKKLTMQSICELLFATIFIKIVHKIIQGN